MLSLTEMAVTSQEAEDYATSRGYSNWYDDAGALRRGQDYVAGMYNQRWLKEFDNDDAPDAVKFAIVEAAIRELQEPNSLAPDLERGGEIKSLKAGSVEIVYADGATTETVRRAIENLLIAGGMIAPRGGTTVVFTKRA